MFLPGFFHLTLLFGDSFLFELDRSWFTFSPRLQAPSGLQTNGQRRSHKPTERNTRRKRGRSSKPRHIFLSNFFFKVTVTLYRSGPVLDAPPATCSFSRAGSSARRSRSRSQSPHWTSATPPRPKRRSLTESCRVSSTRRPRARGTGAQNGRISPRTILVTSVEFIFLKVGLKFIE